MKETINFCEFSPEKMTLLLTYLNVLDITENTKCISIYDNENNCIEKKWKNYGDILQIYPKKITTSHYSTVELINEEKYLLLKKIFNE